MRFEHFKQGGRAEALGLYNRALQMDADNVEALVARGAWCVCVWVRVCVFVSLCGDDLCSPLR